ncbi:MAG: hypothetical protein J2O46_02925 [Nocardioides sp.]|nr:hypothetical protein [Nocardioides sp.]
MKKARIATLGAAAVLIGGTVYSAPPAKAAADEGLRFASLEFHCHYEVVHDNLGVYESPGRSVLKTKPFGSIVVENGLCAVAGASDGFQYYNVSCTCAADGEAWMKAKYLYKFSYSTSP